MLEGRLKKQPNKSHNDNSSRGSVKERSALENQPIQHQRERRNNKQSLPSSPHPRRVILSSQSGGAGVAPGTSPIDPSGAD